LSTSLRSFSLSCSISMILVFCCFFFFSSRRRHTRSKRDWSSDVCSSDLRNFYLYRVYKDSASPSQIELLKEKLYRGIATRADITRVTRRLGDDIAKVYGFSIPRQRQAAAMER